MALVTAAAGKFFSNCLALDWLFANADQAADYVARVRGPFARVLTLPMVTVAALQGRTFAAGAMLSLAHDFRVMRADRGFWCLPEAKINIPFTPGMSALIQTRPTPRATHEAMVTARRYGRVDALAAGLVDATADEAGVRRAAVELARPHSGKAGPTIGTIKERMYAAPWRHCARRTSRRAELIPDQPRPRAADAELLTRRGGSEVVADQSLAGAR
jgi:enoyl-CoA hydratase/carnithine racemase